MWEGGCIYKNVVDRYLFFLKIIKQDNNKIIK